MLTKRWGERFAYQSKMITGSNSTSVAGNQNNMSYWFGGFLNALRGEATAYYASGGMARHDSGNITLDVGFGDTAESFDDYNLADSNYSNRKLARVACSVGPRSVTEMCNVIGTFQNNGNENVVVKELGIVISTDSFVSNYSWGHFLIARKVLGTPITIAPGEQYTFTYRITI